LELFVGIANQANLDMILANNATPPSPGGVADD
jgi:hypothetical protein